MYTKEGEVGNRSACIRNSRLRSSIIPSAFKGVREEQPTKMYSASKIPYLGTGSKPGSQVENARSITKPSVVDRVLDVSYKLSVHSFRYERKSEPDKCLGVVILTMVS